jgi:DNA polymerase III epsilon subunit-like protein
MLSDNLSKYRTNSLYIPTNTTPPPPKHKYSHAFTSPVKVPVGISQRIIANKKEFKALCTYFRLKALFYSGVIKEWKKNTPDLCEYLEISRNTFKARIQYLVQIDMLTFDGNDIRLYSLRKLAKRYGTKCKRKHSIKNIPAIDLQIRALALHENFKQQQHQQEKKLIKQVYYEEQQQLILKSGKFETLPSIAEMNINNFKFTQRHKKILKKSVLQAYSKNPELFNTKYMQRAIFTGDFSVPQMRTTLSCMSVAKLLGLKPNASSGHYWEKKLYENYLLEIKGEVLRISDASRIQRIQQMKALSMYANLDENNQRIVEGTYTRSNKRNGKTYAFKRLSNSLSINANALFC